MINVAIVEDEKKYETLLMEHLNRYAKEHGVEFNICVYQDGDEIVEKYDCQYDLILMDIMMRFLNGMAAAEEIREKDEDVIIIFITNMENYAIRGYQVGAFDYILKPITYFALKRSIDRALGKIENKKQDDRMNISTSSGVHRVALDDIIYINSDAHYLNFHTKRGLFRSYMRMKDLEKHLNEKGFYRINKGNIVNLNYVDGVEGNCCIVEEELLPISRGKKKEFMEVLNRYFSQH